MEFIKKLCHTVCAHTSLIYSLAQGSKQRRFAGRKLGVFLRFGQRVIDSEFEKMSKKSLHLPDSVNRRQKTRLWPARCALIWLFDLVRRRILPGS